MCYVPKLYCMSYGSDGAAAEPTILLNVASVCGPVMEDKDRKFLLVGMLMHEFGHALQELFDLEFDGALIESMATASP